MTKKIISVALCALILSCVLVSCGDRSTEGLVYELNEDRTAYYVYDYTGTETSVIIASRYKGKPVTHIGEGAFQDCSDLRSVKIPDSVTSIGAAAFYDCYYLDELTIPESVTSIDATAFYGCQYLIFVEDSQYYADGWLIYCDGGRNGGVELHEGIEDYYDDVDYDEIRGIGNEAFRERAIEYITLPNSIQVIGPSAFQDCLNLKDVYYTGTEEEWATIIIGENNECLTNATIHYNWTGE